MQGKDRLTDLGKKSSVQADVVVDVGEEGGEEGEAFMPEFFEEVGQIKNMMALIRKNIKLIQDEYNKQQWSASVDSKKNAVLEQLLDATNASALQIRNKLKTMKAENDRLPGESAQKRIRSNMHNILTKKFIALVQEYQALQNSYREKYRERVQRQAEIVKPGVSREEVDEMIVSGGNYFADKMLSDSKHLEAKNALLSIQEQQRDIKHLEKSIQELHQVFIDMAAIVEASQDSMTKVEDNTSSSLAAAGTAVKHVTKAEEYLMQRRRRAALLYGGITAIIVTIALVVGLIIAAKLGAFAAM
jgi:t-SNARE complex subunit (syntaxin)